MISPDGASLPATGPDSIRYPDFAVPEPGEVLPLQEGLWWLRMPLPISLDHINLWLLEEQRWLCAGGYWHGDLRVPRNLGAAGGNRAA